MAKSSKIGIRYAQALFDFSVEQGILEAIEQDMVLIAKVIHENRELRLMLNNPVVLKPKKNSILKAIFGAHCHPSTMSFINIITTSGREKHLEAVARHFNECYKDYKGIKTVRLMSAAPVSDAIRKEMVSKVETATGASVVLEEEVMPALIGGFILQYDNKQVDASLLHHFENLRKEFNINRYIRGI